MVFLCPQEYIQDFLAVKIAAIDTLDNNQQ